MDRSADHAALAERAAELLERDGWMRGQPGPTDPTVRGQRCALGALDAAKNDLKLADLRGRTTLMFASWLRRERGFNLGLHAETVWRWNDGDSFSTNYMFPYRNKVAKDQADVIEALRHFAKDMSNKAKPR
jgi:hypothetical protein